MRRKILWITFWLTVTLWLGQARAQVVEVDDQKQPTDARSAEAPVASESAATMLFVAKPMPEPPSDPKTLIDRSSWPILNVGPADGAVTHPQAWLTTKAPTGASLPRLDGAFDLATLETALDGTKPAGYSPANVTAFVGETAQSALYLGLLPLRAVTTEPFWQSDTTP